MYIKTVALFALLAGASAFAPQPSTFGVRLSTSLHAYEYGEYDNKLWDSDAKDDVYAKWDPSQPRTTRNFNPYETFGGNSPDASGKYPGEPRYKDPKRGNISFAIMMEERKAMESRDANPKEGDVAGAPGRKNQPSKM